MEDQWRTDLEEAIAYDVGDWELLVRFLPAGWQQKARELGALRRAKGFADAGSLLRTLLIHLAGGHSLKETALRASDGAVANVSSVAIWKRLRHAGDWLRWMAQGVMRTWVERLPRAVFPASYRVRLVDATSISEPGSTGSDWRIHYAVDLNTLQCDCVQVTDVEHGAESLKRFSVAPGDLLIGDRAYATRAGIAHVVGRGGDVLVRLPLTNLPLETAGGKPFRLLKKLRTLRVGQVGDWTCWTKPERPGEQPVALRVCALKKSRTAAEQARRKVRQDAIKQGRESRPETIEAARYVFVVTTLPRNVLSAEDVLEIYRGRWQIELVFKRLKSILGLGHLPKHDPQGATAWLHGKLLVAFLVEAIIHAGDALFPCGYPIAPTTPSRRE